MITLPELLTLFLTVFTVKVARRDAKRWGVHPFRRLAPDEFFLQPPMKGET